MKVVIGTDLARNFEQAVEVLTALKFPDLEAVVVNVVEPVVTAAGSGEFASMGVMSLLVEDLQNAGHAVVKEASDELIGRGIRCESTVLSGQPAGCLTDVAKEKGADLVVIGGPVRSLFEKFLTGSVSRDLAVSAEQSVLIGRKSPSSDNGLTVLFAHDHSDYCDRALDRFVAMRPAGIVKVVLVTADTTDSAIVALTERDMPQIPGEAIVSVKDFLAQRTEAAKTRLQALGCPVESHVVEGDANAVLSRAMKEHAADLMVMGAKGHGFIERLFLGSVALHHVVREDYNLLLVRA
ncbi:MAG: universal stress protein [Armatimonadetes bacterium]|nr:universal stress protein [Armatimonadota bacterium]